ncbi:MAG: type II toxin-antitoxin system Phd/YefM family antitoxin [bacterium]|nr:type II toxin-antitoxin system Phd/YefM family antitoxin [bacterium]MCY3889074.1 type II toxin-antitoxin system Phd/YefM family antitoxin [bacterium]MCY3961146.1 type II toxin-antitoxin system Phd/YefM family antitoxin [bacterium]
MSSPSAEQIIAAGDFKAKCLALMDRVRDEGVEFVITKYGHPVARLVPCEPKREVPTLRGMGRGQITIHGDLTEPTFGDAPVEEMLANWDAMHHSRSDDSA